MSSMRDTYVGIYFEDEASKVLDQIDRKMDEAERTVMGLGTKLDKTSSGFSSMGKVGVRSVGNINQKVGKTGDKFSGLKSTVSGTGSSITKSMSGGIQSVGKLNQKVGETGRGFGRLKDTIIGVGSAIGAVKVIEKGISMVKGAVDGAISRVDTLAGFPVVMEKMGFSSELAQSSVDKLSEGISGLPTTLDGIVGSTQNISLMTGDLDKATDTALTLNNAFLASGSDAMDAERGLDQYVKMLSKGKVEADSWSTLQETMGFALNKTATAFGFTGKSAQQDLYKALQKGKITFDQFNNKLIELNGGVGGFAEIAKEGSAGIGTSFSNMNTAVVRGVAGIIQSTQEVLAKTPLKSIENIFGLIGTGFSKTLGGIAEKIKGIDAKALGDKFTQGFNTVKSVAIPTLGAIKTGLGWLVDNKDMVIAATAGIAGGFAVFKTITTVQTALNLFKNSMTLSTIATQGFNAALRANPIGMVVTAIGLLVTAGVYLYQNWDTVKEKAGMLWERLKDNPLMALAAGPFGALVAAGVTLYNNFDKIKASFNSFVTAIKSFKLPDWVSSIGSTFSSAASKVGSWFTGKDGSHASGLERVPFDGYVAELHKGEAVLTANQSNALRSAGILSKGSSGTPELNLDNNTSESVPALNNNKQTNTPSNNGGHQFVFHITGDNPTDIAQKVREVISDILDSEMQTT